MLTFGPEVDHAHLADEVCILNNMNVQKCGRVASIVVADNSASKTEESELTTPPAIRGHSLVEESHAPRIPWSQGANSMSGLDRRRGGISLYRRLSFTTNLSSLRIGTLTYMVIHTGYYFAAAGTVNSVFMMASTAAYSFCSNFPRYWIKWWTEAGLESSAIYMLGYLVLSLASWMAISGTGW